MLSDYNISTYDFATFEYITVIFIAVSLSGDKRKQLSVRFIFCTEGYSVQWVLVHSPLSKEKKNALDDANSCTSSLTVFLTY